MKCYILNASLGSETQLSGWLSFIWTERYAKESEVVISFPATSYYMNLVKEDTMLRLADSDEPMVIETAQVKTENDIKKWVVSGRDLTSWLDLRVSPWDVDYNGQRASVSAYNIINRTIITTGTAQDKFPNVGLRNVANDTATFDFETTKASLLEDAQNALNDGDCAIRCRLLATSPRLMMEIYNGRDRPVVVFSERDQTLLNTQFIRSKKKLRNVADVWYKTNQTDSGVNGSRLVYGNGGSPSLSGTNRRAIRVDATSVNVKDYPGNRFNALLDRMGRIALGQNKLINAVDGEIPAYSPYVYRKHYWLGDIVTFKSVYSTSTKARVTEYIWIVDADGERSYPTVDIIDDISV